MGKFLSQLWILLYKNYLFKKRNKKGTLLEVGVVLYFVAILAIIKVTSNQDTKPGISQSETMKFNLNNSMVFPTKGFGFVFGNTNQTSIFEKVVSSMEAASGMKGYRFESEDKLDEFYQNNPTNFTVGLLFDIDGATQQFSYTVKVATNEMVSVNQDGDGKWKNAGEEVCRQPKILNDYRCPGAKYINSNFAAVQALVDLKYIEVSTKQKISLPLDASVKMFPKPEYTPPNEQLKNVVGIYMVIAFAPYISFLLTNIVKEKETKIKESMKIMGLNMLAYWISWFITYAVIVFIGCALTTAILTAVKVFGDTHFLIIFFVFLLYGFSIITLSFMLTPLFTNAKNAGSFASLGTMILSLIGLIHNYVDTGVAVKWVTSLMSPVALSLSLQPALDYSSPLTWDNISSKGDFPTSNGLVMLLVDTILYLLLAIYLDLIFPGEYGKAKHPLFLCSPSFWTNMFAKKDNVVRRQSSLLHSQLSHQDDENTEASSEDIEVVDEHLMGGKVISIHNLKKVFKQGKDKPDIKALNGVSFDVYEGQITALLGHNGAGKSTLISILTGMLMPSSGSAEMYGFNIRDQEELDNIRQIVGLCPQQNIIFDQLDPREHLLIYAGIKGVPKDVAEGMVNTLLTEIDLSSQVNTVAKDLSGGQQRKLCIGIALIGNPKIVFLDEPTSGMDPSSRRHIWNLLQSKRKDRVIFLTTHFMDEADVLADSKAILSSGKIRCSGSSLFLKSRFGIGYHLGMVVEEDANIDTITNIVANNVAGSEVSRRHGKELAYRLPLSEASKFPDLFKALEESNPAESEQFFTAPKLGIITYGVSMTTLEEVFLKLGDEDEELQEQEQEQENEPDSNEEVHGRTNPIVVEDESHLTVDETALSGSATNLHNSSLDLHPTEFNVQSGNKQASMWVQLMALLEVRFKRTIRNPMKILFLGVLPPILLVVGLVLMRNLNTKTEENETNILKLSPSIYLQQGDTFASTAKKILWKLNSAYSSNETAIKNGFSKAKLKNLKVTDLDLMKLAPHVVAYDVRKVAEAGNLGYTLYWNASQVHSVPVGINTLSNVMYHIMNSIASPSPPRNASTLPIVTYNKPFKSRQPQWTYDYAGQVAVLLIGLSVATMAGGFAIEVVFYREIGVRHQLRVSGTSRLMYWLMFCIGDVLMYIPLIIILFILIPAMDIKSFNNSVALGATFLLLIMYIFASLFFSYTFSFIFQKGESAQNAMMTIINMLSIIPFFAVTITDMASGSVFDKPFHATLAKILCVLDPPFTFMAGLYYISRVYRVETLLSGDLNVQIPASKYFGWEDKNNALPAIYIIMLFHILLLVFLTYAIDCYKAGGFVVFPFSLVARLKRSCSFSGKRVSRQSTRRSGSQENADVTKERQEVAQCILEGQVSNTGVVVQGLKKSFGHKKAVRDITFKVQKGEILGLLGPNGAGKTTSLNMVTADLRPDKGEVYIGGYNIETELNKAFQNLGYCPQFDSVWKNVTIREHLKCYGLIKGIPAKKLPELINHYADALKIRQHMDKYSQDLSGGTKRKLSFLISMIGNAGIVILDEPSTGMDPGARRFLWTVISANIKDTRGAILTTHSMEEADALCARVGIVVKGQLKCIGTTQELKSSYGGGYQLEVKFKIEEGEDAVEKKRKVDDYVRGMFLGALEMEYFGTRVMYKIPNKAVTNLSIVFAQLEAGKVDVSIEEYSFSQSSLEQVFLEFAKEQDDDATGRTEENEDDDNHDACA